MAGEWAEVDLDVSFLRQQPLDPKPVLGRKLE